jgi:hypothetical protein
MRVFAALIVLVLAGAVAGGGPAFAACIPTDDGQLKCTIRTPSDCYALRNYPYARTLFCPAAFSAVQSMVARVAKTIGVGGPAAGELSFFQTLADPKAPPEDQAQTVVGCADTSPPWGSPFVRGAGTPLCHLLAYVTSPGPLPWGPPTDAHNPVPRSLRGFPRYLGALYDPNPALPLTEFHSGSGFDPLVANLGLAAHALFVRDYPGFSSRGIYAPGFWRVDPEYHGISGGGGGGWGGEIAVLGDGGTPVSLLVFGGGGGGGLRSFRQSPGGKASSALGAGGGGGVQFGNGYLFEGRSYTGLGLGAGGGSDPFEITYDYDDYEGSGNPPLPAHQYNPAVIAEYEAQLKNLAAQLRALLAEGKSVVLRGGGGMGAGSEYLDPSGAGYVPVAFATQGGYQFSYEFRAPQAPPDSAAGAAWRQANAEEEDAYSQLGEFFRVANKEALAECGGDYSNYACICPKAQAIVICLMSQALGDPSKIPAWLQEPHCPSPGVANGPSGLKNYQQFLFAEGSEVGKRGVQCSADLIEFFTAVNTPAGEPY